MGAVTKTPLPKASRLWAAVSQGDFIDGYAVHSELSAKDALRIGLRMPKWADALLKLRNVIVRPLGLKTEMDETRGDSIFPTVHEDDNEMIVGTDDRHLNFRIAVHRKDDRIHMATWVHPNNFAGRAYLAIVMPFHILIVRDAMRRIARAPIA